MTRIVVSGEIRIDAEDFDAAMALVEPFVAMTQAEAGCVAYDFWVDPRDHGRIRVFEEWESEADQRAHAESSHLAEFYAALASVRVVSVELIQYVVSAHAPL